MTVHSMRLYSQSELDELLNRAADDGLQAGAQATADAYHEGFSDGYAQAVADIESGDPKGARHYLGRGDCE